MKPEGAGDLVDIATVVFSRELDLLQLQARSIDRFLDPRGIGRILVVINDAEEAACVARAAAIVPDYGRFAARVEIVGADALFALRPARCGPRGLVQRVRHGFTRHRRLFPFGVKGGWRGNRGWSVQQAMKLAVARHASAAFLLILDAKNHFIRPVTTASFVSDAGRARSYGVVPDTVQWPWIEASFRRFGLPPPDRGAPAPPSVTPFCAPRAVVSGCLDALEARVGPAEAFFARKDSRETEFMLIYAHVVAQHGSWAACFDQGLVPAATMSRVADDARVDRVLGLAEDGTAEILSVHSGRIASLRPQDRRRLAAIWADRHLTPPGRLAISLTPEG